MRKSCIILFALLAGYFCDLCKAQDTVVLAGPFLADANNAAGAMPIDSTDSATSNNPPTADGVDESYFYKSLKKDSTMIAPPSVHTSTREADGNMLQAIQSGDQETLKDILEHAVDPHTFDPDRFSSTPVFWAIHFNQPACLKLLLDHCAGNDGPTHFQAKSASDLALRTHPGLLPILQEGLKHNHTILTAQLIANLHSIHIDLPAFSNTPYREVTEFIIQATSGAGYLERGVGVTSFNVPQNTAITSPSKSNISIWNALQTIADANNLRFDANADWAGDIWFYPPRLDAIVHTRAAKIEAPTSAAPRR